MAKSDGRRSRSMVGGLGALARLFSDSRNDARVRARAPLAGA